MKHVKGSMIVTLVASLGMSVAHAGLMNAGFETGMTGWGSSLSGGAATVVTSNSTTYVTPATYLPQEGSYFLAIQAGSANTWQTVFQSLTVSIGETVSGLAAFDWGDYLPYADGARVRILDAAGAEVAVPFYLDGNITPGTQKSPGQADAGYNGPWTAWSWTATSAGTYTVEFGARNTLDGGGPNQSFGYFDAAQVPEPASLALVGIGLAGLGMMRRRKAA